MNEKITNGMKQAEFTNFNDLSIFLNQYGRKLSLDECMQVVRDYLAGKEDWMPEM